MAASRSIRALRRGSLLLAALAVAALVCQAADETKKEGSQPKVLVFEVEDWSEPKDAWKKNTWSEDKWNLWTTEEDVEKKRSRGASLQSPRIEKDRATPEEGAPPLHTHITGIPPGFYSVYLDNLSRRIALSFDGGRKWLPFDGARQVHLGFVRIKDGTLDVWADDRYANPGAIGWCYYDCLRLVPAEELAFRHFDATPLPGGSTRLTWVTSHPVEQCELIITSADGKTTRVAEAETGMRNHKLVVRGLQKGGAYEVRACVKNHWGDTFESKPVRFVASAGQSPPSSRTARVPLFVRQLAAYAKGPCPVTSGVPFAKGTLTGAQDVRLLDEDGKAAPAQLEVTSRWPDGSVKWLLVDVVTPMRGFGTVGYALETGPGVGSRTAPVDGAVRVKETADGCVISNNVMRLAIDKRRPDIPGELRVDLNGDGRLDDNEIVIPQAPQGALLLLLGKSDQLRMAPPDVCAVEQAGPVRATVRLGGDFVTSAGGRAFRYDVRLTCWAGLPIVKMAVTFGNNVKEQTFSEVGAWQMHLPLVGGAEEASIDGAAFVPVEAGKPFLLLQDYENHFALKRGDKTSSGEKARGTASVRNRSVQADVFVRDFWQGYPKGFSIDAEGLRIDLLPKLPADQYTSEDDKKLWSRLFFWCRDGRYLLKRGVEYTAEVFLQAGAPGDGKASRLAECFQPSPFAAAPPEHYCSTGVFGKLVPARPGEFEDYEEAVELGYERLMKNRRDKREYGWINFGDWHGERRYNWGNHEYDLQWVGALEFARTGDLRHLSYADQAAKHSTDVDTIHYPWAERMGGIVYAHSLGHVGVDVPADDKALKEMNWGIWASTGWARGCVDARGHIFQQGNFIMGHLTGNHRYLDVAEDVVRHQAAYLTPAFSFGIERAAGWPMINAVAAYEATGDPFYLNAARIYLEKIYELQDPETGGWRMKQGHPECNCPDAPHIGGKAFATGILLRGMIMYDTAAPDDEVKHSIVRGVDWLMQHSWNPERRGFRYKTGCPKYATSGDTHVVPALVAEAFAYAYELTGDEKYRRFMLTMLERVAECRTGNGKNYAMFVRQTSHCFPHLLKWGMKSLPYRAPAFIIPEYAYLGADGEAAFCLGFQNRVNVPVPLTWWLVDAQGAAKASADGWSGEIPAGGAVCEAVRASLPKDAAAQTIELKVESGRRKWTCSVPLRPLPPADVAIGDKLGFVGPGGHYTLAALESVGLKPDVLPDLRSAKLDGFGVIIVGSDVWSIEGLGLQEAHEKLLRFALSGGRLVLFQLNDSDWPVGALPLVIAVSDENTAAGEIAKPEHPLFRQLESKASVARAVCYDSLAALDDRWDVLLRDQAGRPCVVEARMGKGSVLVIMPSFDRYVAKTIDDVKDFPVHAAERLMLNLASYLKPQKP